MIACFVTPKSDVGVMICQITGGRFCHVALILDDGRAVTALMERNAVVSDKRFFNSLCSFG